MPVLFALQRSLQNDIRKRPWQSACMRMQCTITKRESGIISRYHDLKNACELMP